MITSLQLTESDLRHLFASDVIDGYHRLEWSERQQAFHNEASHQPLGSTAYDWQVITHSMPNEVLRGFTQFMWAVRLRDQARHFSAAEVKLLFEAFVLGWGQRLSGRVLEEEIHDLQNPADV